MQVRIVRLGRRRYRVEGWINQFEQIDGVMFATGDATEPLEAHVVRGKWRAMRIAGRLWESPGPTSTAE